MDPRDLAPKSSTASSGPRSAASRAPASESKPMESQLIASSSPSAGANSTPKVRSSARTSARISPARRISVEEASPNNRPRSLPIRRVEVAAMRNGPDLCKCPYTAVPVGTPRWPPPNTAVGFERWPKVMLLGVPRDTRCKECCQPSFALKRSNSSATSDCRLLGMEVSFFIPMAIVVHSRAGTCCSFCWFMLDSDGRKSEAK
mmetsp:Transcript_126657/g.316559  ORF Transcript_126657/g.316559 Transcript_126657/m.316559 type:complete len:203 (+) Transcript_126657:186-794(+)